MSKPITAEDKAAVQQFIRDGQEERIFHIQDMEAVSVLDGKHDRERKAREDARRRTEEAKLRIRLLNEEMEKQQEEFEARQAENRQGLKKAFGLAGCIAAAGLLHIAGAVRPEFAIVTGGVCVLCALVVIGIALYAYRAE